MAAVKWSFPNVRRDTSYIETFSSKSKGKVSVPDPYHWLTQPPSISSEVKKFVEDQAAFTESYLEKIPTRDKFSRLVKDAWNYAKISVPVLKGDGSYYLSYNSGLQNQSVIYRVSSLEHVPKEGPPGEVFFDPNSLSSDGTSSISTSAFSKDGAYFAYAVSEAGSDWTTIYVKSTDPKKTDPEDELKFTKFTSISWTHDNAGFFYQRLPGTSLQGADADKDATLVYHRVGTSQEEDILILNDPEHPTRSFHAEVTDDGAYVCVYLAESTANENLFWVSSLKDGVENLKFDKIVDEWGKTFEYITNDGPVFTIMTNEDAPNNKLIKFNIETREASLFIAHDKSRLLQWVAPINFKDLVVSYLQDVKDQIFVYDLETGKEKHRLLPDLVASVAGVSGRRDQTKLFLAAQSFTSPTAIYEVDFATGESSPKTSLWKETVVSGIDPADFTTEQVFYKSKDGTKVPMFITRPKNVKLDGTAPALQYGHGGFGISVTPFFSPDILTWIKHYKGIFAVPNIRGGGEYGDVWHQQGTFGNKQNVFDDFIAATHFLIDNKYAHPKHVAIEGRSNGGLLVGACLTQAPELYGATLPEVGVLDMLHFHKFTIGGYWRSDYGDPDVADDFDYIYAYSPLHNIDAAKAYPPTLVITSDHDDRVVPMHSFKFISELQHARTENKDPLLIRVTTNSGHGSGMSTERRIQEIVDRYSFIAHAQGLAWYDGDSKI